jgi:lipopolysaccharide/colanic/teichoic acid biosynthesis glycosyltransferase
MYRRWGKRFLDIIGALLLIIIFSPVFLIIGFLIKLDDFSAVIIFKTDRLARGGCEYKLLKFRTMVPRAEERLQELLKDNPEICREYESTYKIKDDPRITRLGKTLRRWSLDELPQFFNVLLGDMSLVGPRQILASELWKYGEYGGKLITVRPGITGLWQVSGRSRLSYEERVSLDMIYIDKLSFWLDLKILVLTPYAVLRGDGAI